MSRFCGVHLPGRQQRHGEDAQRGQAYDWHEGVVVAALQEGSDQLLSTLVPR